MGNRCTCFQTEMYEYVTVSLRLCGIEQAPSPWVEFLWTDTWFEDSITRFTKWMVTLSEGIKMQLEHYQELIVCTSSPQHQPVSDMGVNQAIIRHHQHLTRAVFG
ncbi:hypothetical protein J6590_096792 [Homalodisca vitripennis]|nr:hypothetical protein J6590_096792 [Homalodisca vitripennis]